MDWTALFISISFVLNLWCCSHKRVLDLIKSKYGECKFKEFRKLTDHCKKLEKSKLDLKFLIALGLCV